MAEPLAQKAAEHEEQAADRARQVEMERIHAFARRKGLPSEWAERVVGLKPWPAEDVTKASTGGRRLYDVLGAQLTLTELSELSGLTTSSIRMRWHKGLRPDMERFWAQQRASHDPQPGDRFGMFVVVCDGEPSTDGRRRLRCRCDCGATRDVRVHDLVRDIVRSCGCQDGRRRDVKEWIGRTVGRLTVLNADGDLWQCRCACGEVVERTPAALVHAVAKGHMSECFACRSERTQANNAARAKLNSVSDRKPDDGASPYRSPGRPSDEPQPDGEPTLTLPPIGQRVRDLVGRRFGFLVVEHCDESVEQTESSVHWVCRCDCGNTTSVLQRLLLAGRTKSCGCRFGGHDDPRRKNLVGRRFGRLLVDHLDPRQKIGRMQRWVCLCDCGRTTSVIQCHLVTGRTKSCGCLLRRYHELFGKRLSIDELAELAGVPISVMRSRLKHMTPERAVVHRTRR